MQISRSNVMHLISGVYRVYLTPIHRPHTFLYRTGRYRSRWNAARLIAPAKRAARENKVARRKVNYVTREAWIDAVAAC